MELNEMVYEKLKYMDKELREMSQEIENRIYVSRYADEVFDKLKSKESKNDEVAEKCILAEMFGRREALGYVADKLSRIRKELVGK